MGAIEIGDNFWCMLQFRGFLLRETFPVYRSIQVALDEDTDLQSLRSLGLRIPRLDPEVVELGPA